MMIGKYAWMNAQIVIGEDGEMRFQSSLEWVDHLS